MKKKMKNDIVHKESVFIIDNTCVRLDNKSCKIQANPGIEEVVKYLINYNITVYLLKDDRTRSTPLSWDQHSDGNHTSSSGNNMLVLGIPDSGHQMQGPSQRNSGGRLMGCWILHVRNS